MVVWTWGSAGSGGYSSTHVEPPAVWREGWGKQGGSSGLKQEDVSPVCRKAGHPVKSVSSTIGTRRRGAQRTKSQMTSQPHSYKLLREATALYGGWMKSLVSGAKGMSAWIEKPWCAVMAVVLMNVPLRAAGAAYEANW